MSLEIHLGPCTSSLQTLAHLVRHDEIIPALKPNLNLSFWEKQLRTCILADLSLNSYLATIYVEVGRFVAICSASLTSAAEVEMSNQISTRAGSSIQGLGVRFQKSRIWGLGFKYQWMQGLGYRV